MDLNAIENIAGVIQLAVAPVFLLAGIAGMLNVMSIRLGRVVDRARIVEARLAIERHDHHKVTLQSETEGLWKRIRLVNWSLRMFVCAALLVHGCIHSTVSVVKPPTVKSRQVAWQKAAKTRGGGTHGWYFLLTDANDVSDGNLETDRGL